MKKVLIVGGEYFHYIYGTADAFRNLGYDVHIIITKVFYRDKLRIGEYIKYKCNKKRYIKNFYEAQREKIFKYVMEKDIDILVAYNTNFFCEVLNKKVLNNLKRNKIICTIYGFCAEKSNN